MKLKSIFLAAALASVFGTALAGPNDYNSGIITLNGGPGAWSTSFGTTHTTSGAFTDTFTFAYTGDPGNASGFFANFANDHGKIVFSSANINGYELLVDTYPDYVSGSIFNYVPANGTLVLTISGETYGTPASYAGTIDVVPEPATYGMLLGGLAVVGYAIRRRKEHAEA